MINLSNFIFKDQDKFYFDPENYTNDENQYHHLTFEDGDMIKWTWEGTKMYGTLRTENKSLNLFAIEKVNVIQ
jgi:hypothetical protein